MARYDLYRDIAQAGQIAQAYKRDIKTYSSDEGDTDNNVDGFGLSLGVPVHFNDSGHIRYAGSLDKIIGITCFSPLLINPKVSNPAVFYHQRRDPVSVLTKGKIYVLVADGSPNVSEFDVAYITLGGLYTNVATNNKEIGIFLSSGQPGDLVILQFDLSTHAVSGL